MVRAFRHRNFRLYFSGQCVSMVGTLMQGVALSWVVYQLTHSAVLLGWVGFAGQLPLFLLTPLAGVFVDRYSRHKILIITQTVIMSFALLMALLAFTHHLAVWNILLLNVLGGTMLSIDMPSRQAFVADLVEHGDDLSNAVALNSFIVNGAKILGPTMAGLALSILNPAFCFLVNGLSYIAVIAALRAMQIAPTQAHRLKSAPAHHAVLEGWRYAWQSPPIRTILALVALVGLMAAAYGVLMPIFADKVFHGGAHTLGYLLAAPGVGALIAGISLALRKSVVGAEIQIAVGTVVCGIGLIVLAESRWLPLSLVALLISGWGMVTQFALSNTVLQTLVENDKRGRVMSLFTTAIMGMTPFGSLLGGTLAGKFGAPFTVGFCGMTCIAGGLYFALKLPALQRWTLSIYREKGLLPEITSGLEAAKEFPQLPQD